MNRRRFLATAGVSLLGGCAFRETDETPTGTPTPVSQGTPTTEATVTPASDGAGSGSVVTRVRAADRIVEFETAPLTASLVGRSRTQTADGLKFHYSLVEPETPDSPAVVWAAIENAQAYEQIFRPDRVPGFDGSATIVPTENHDLLGYSVGVTRGDDGRWRRNADLREWREDPVIIGAGGVVFGEYHLVAGDPITPGRYDNGPSGDVRFTVTVWPTDAPGPDGESAFEGRSVPEPPFGGPVVWYHEADAGTEVYLEPSTERVTAPGRVEFTLRNYARQRVSISDGPLFKLVEGSWYRVKSGGVGAIEVEPGETATTTLGLFDGPSTTDKYWYVGHLGGGRYAYIINRGGQERRCAAMFDLEAPAVSPGLEEGVDVERDGEEVVVTTPEWNDADKHSPRSELIVERTDRDADRRVVAEQLFRRRFRAYRNTLPAFEAGVERVVLRTDWSTVDETAGLDDLELTVAYDGERFHVEGENPYTE
jgi:hypothetical protein